jgi:hypothetical protein
VGIRILGEQKSMNKLFWQQIVPGLVEGIVHEISAVGLRIVVRLCVRFPAQGGMQFILY